MPASDLRALRDSWRSFWSDGGSPMKTIFWTSAWDGCKYRITPAKGKAWRWKASRCWAAGCANAILAIHVSPNGYATHGYCFHEANQPERLYRLWPRGQWFVALDGKLELIKRPVPPATRRGKGK